MSQAWIWNAIEELSWCRRTRSELTAAEQEFVEATALDKDGNWGQDLERMKALLDEHPSIIERAGAAALSTAIRSREPDEESAEVVRFLVENGARFEYARDCFSPVHEAAWSTAHGQQGIERFRIIFEAGLADAAQVGIEPPHNGLTSGHRSLLHIAAMFGHPALTELLLAHGAAKVIEVRLNGNADTALQRAAHAGLWRGRRREVAEILLAHGAYYDILSACALDDEARLRALLAEDPTAVGARHSDRTTPLHWAAAAGAGACAKVLLAGGAEVGALNSGKKTPLHKAAEPHGVTPADWTFPPIERVIALLVQNGANVNAPDTKGRTPLHLATYGGSAAVAEQLMALGADTTVKNKRGKTAFEVARMDCLYLKPRPGKARRRAAGRQ